MSKQGDAKIKQNYQAKPLSHRCRVCKHLIVEKKKVPRYGDWEMEHLKCGIGGFKVTANAVCDLFEMKAGENNA